MPDPSHPTPPPAPEAPPAAASIGRRLGLAALLLSVSVLASRLLGYVREAVIAYQAGASQATDAYYAAFTLPDLMSYFLAGGTLSIVFVPMFAAFLERGEEAQGWRLFSTLATVTGLALGAALAAALLWTEPLIGWLFSGFSPQGQALTVEMTRIVLPSQLFFVLGGLLAATLMARGRFRTVALAPLIYNLCIIACGLLLGPQLGMRGFAIGALVGAALGPFGLNLWGAWRHLRFRPRLALAEPGFRRYVMLSLPLLIGASLVSVDEWIGRVLGSHMQTGTVSWLNYARRLMMVPLAVIGQAIGQAALPFLARLAAADDRQALGQVLTRTLRVLLLLSMLASALTAILADPLVTLVYERGAFDPADTARTARVLRLYALGIAAWGLQGVCARAFYAEQDTWTPMVISTLITLVSLPLYVSLGHRMGAEGLALAATLGVTLQALATLALYRRRNPHLDLSALGATLGRGLLICAGAATVSWGVAQVLQAPLRALASPSSASLIMLAAAGGAGLLTAVLGCGALGVPELDALLSRLRRRRP